MFFYKTKFWIKKNLCRFVFKWKLLFKQVPTVKQLIVFHLVSFSQIYITNMRGTSIANNNFNHKVKILNLHPSLLKKKMDRCYVDTCNSYLCSMEWVIVYTSRSLVYIPVLFLLGVCWQSPFPLCLKLYHQWDHPLSPLQNSSCI